jgi:hypothetical protein
MQIPIDEYRLKARLLPALLALLPLVLTGIVIFPSLVAGWKSLYSFAVSCGLLYLLAELGRRAGKQRQAALFASWGGKPSVVFLRHRGAGNSTLVLERHRKLGSLFPELSLPTREEEEKNIDKADEVYEVAGIRVIELTRDKKRFYLLFQENCSYGFWRNSWGLKPVGITCSVLSIGAIAAVLGLRSRYFQSIDPKLLAVPLLFDLGFVCMWSFWITPRSIKVPAEAYAERLFEACDTLLKRKQATTKKD